MLVGVLAMALSAAASDFVPGGPCTRGRVTNNGTTIITDWGTLLRGGCWALDMIRGLPPRQDLVTIKQCGVNLVHVYFEKYDASYCYVGYNAERMDTLVEWCRQESLYVIMTIGSSIVGTWNDGRTWELDSIKAIWRFYAPRYADQTHVIYEIKNEACNATFHCEEPVMQMFRDVYRLIRESAPQTHILLLSHSNLKGGINSLLEDIERLDSVVDWTNASIAFHGYGTTGEFQEDAVKAATDAGCAMTMTECWPNTGLEGHYEHAQISYAPMAGCFSPMAQRKCDQMKKCNLSYAPDFGSWPQQHVEHIPLVVEALFAPAGRAADKGRSTVLFPLIRNSVLRGDVRAVYDLSGRLLWRRTDNANAASDGEGFIVPKGAGARTVVVKYAD